jgi:hypothetical protein
MSNANVTSTEQSHFHVSKGNQTLGPWTVAEMASNLAQGVIAITDFAYDEKASDWIALFELGALKNYLQAAKPKAPPPGPAKVQALKAEPEQVAAPAQKKPHVHTAIDRTEEKSPLQTSNEAEWYVQKGQQRYGPFTYLGVLQALQEKTVYEFDLIWTQGMEQWMRVAEHEAFQADAVRKLVHSDMKTPGIFAHRQFPRLKFESEVLAHDNHSVWLGRAFQGSAGGSGLIIENATLVPGQSLVLHFSEHDGLPAFNAFCEIVSKKFSKEIQGAKTPVAYGVRFLQVESSAEALVKQYFLREIGKSENRKLVS